MMEFLDKIYSYDNFGILLFSAIAILVVLFLVILFFGKKDEKKRELEATKQLEQPSIDGFNEVNSDAVALDVNVPTFAPVEEMVAPIDESVSIIPEVDEVPLAPIEPSLDVAPLILESTEEKTPIVEETVHPVSPVLEPIVEPVIPVVQNEIPESPVIMPDPFPTFEKVVEPEIKEEPKTEIQIPDFNFDELAASIANELSALEKNSESVTEITDPEPVIPVVNNDIPVTPINDIVTPVIETPKPTSRPVTFSSVYINKPEEPNTIEVKESFEDTVVNNAPVAPVSNIELPKVAEMPALKEETPNLEGTPAIPDFSQIEGESYDIK